MELDYSDENKAMAHDQERWAWEGASGFTFMDSDDPLIHPTALDVSKAFEYGFSIGWDRATNEKENN